MKNIYKISLISAFGLGIISVMAYVASQAKKLKDACYTLAGAMVHEISFQNFSFTLLLNISNKSDIDFVVTKQLYNIYINNMLVATIDNPEKIKVRGNGKSTINIDVSFNPQDLLKKGMENISMLIGNKDNLIIEIKGNLSLKAGIVSVNDYKVDERLSMKEILAPSKSKNKC